MTFPWIVAVGVFPTLGRNRKRCFSINPEIIVPHNLNWSVKFSESKLAPTHWWSFDESDFTDKASGIALVQENATAAPLFIDGVTKKAFQVSYVAEGENPNLFSAGLTPEYGDNGLSVCGFGKFARGGEFGLIDPSDSNAFDGHHLGIRWSYRQPGCMLPAGHGQPVPATTTADRMESGKWHNLALTLSRPIDPRTHENFTVDFESNQYGTFTYTSPDVEYSRTCASTQYIDYFTYGVRLARFYIDGILKGEMLIVQRPEVTDPPGRGYFSLKMENTSEQDGTYPDAVDEIKLFEKELSLAEIRSECALIGLQFLNANPTGTEGGRVQKIGRDGRRGRSRSSLSENEKFRHYCLSLLMVSLQCNNLILDIAKCKWQGEEEKNAFLLFPPPENLFFPLF